MPPSKSASQIKKLGDRLRHSETAAEVDLLQLQALRAEYDPPLQAAGERLRALGLQPSSRIKTINTLVEKLKRDATNLAKMQDIGGLRIVKDMKLAEQDSLRDQIVEAFPGAKVIDRRTDKNNHGYRAIHIIVEVDGFPLEIQLRTQMQDSWAQLVEKLGDFFGRGLRYGDPPKGQAERSITAHVMSLSEMVGGVESLETAGFAEAEEASDRARAHFNREVAELMTILDSISKLPRQP